MLTRFAAAFPMNCYLVGEEDGLTLVDATTASPASEVAAHLAEMGLELRRLVLTHAHGDHAGGVDGVVERFPGIELSIGRREARLLAGDRTLDPGEPQASVKGFFEKVMSRPARLLQAGDMVGSLQVVATPGHTPGHIALLDTRDRTLIAGDAFQTRGGVAVAGVLRPLFPFPAMGTWHKPTALASAEALAALQPTALAVGHGAILDSPILAMSAAVDHARRAFG